MRRERSGRFGGTREVGQASDDPRLPSGQSRRRYSSSIRLAVSLASSKVSTKFSSGTRRRTFSA